MAKAEWCTVAPTSGNGNKTIAISATAHTGRVARSTTVTVQNQTGAKPSKVITVNQAAKIGFITKTSGPNPASLPVAGGVITIIGKSNAKTISLDAGDLIEGYEFKANGVLQEDWNGDITNPIYTIEGDLGSTSEYSFECKITFQSNPLAIQFAHEITFSGYSSADTEDKSKLGNFKVTIAQSAATSSLSTDKTALSLDTVGTGQNIVVNSNDDWIVS